MARYGQKFKDNAVARLLPPQSCPVETLSARIGISVSTLERWRAEALAKASGSNGGGASRWTAAARLEAVIATAAMDEATRGAWCREQGLYPAELDAWKQDAIAGLGEPAMRDRGDEAGPAPHQGVGAGPEPQGQGAGRNGRLARAVKKTLGDLPRRRGRMTRLEDRQTLAREIEHARMGGARLAEACAFAGIDPRTVQRWRAGDGLTRGDRRPDAVRPASSHALSEAERARIVTVANEPRFADTPPARIVPARADEGVYIGSESSFHRVLRAHGQMNRRGRAHPPRKSRPPTTHIATQPGEVWCWDMTFLPAQIQGRWFYFYMILDIYSRKIVGFEVHATTVPIMPRISPDAPCWRKVCMRRR